MHREHMDIHHNNPDIVRKVLPEQPRVKFPDEPDTAGAAIYNLQSLLEEQQAQAVYVPEVKAEPKTRISMALDYVKNLFGYQTKTEKTELEAQQKKLQEARADAEKLLIKFDARPSREVIRKQLAELLSRIESLIKHKGYRDFSFGLKNSPLISLNKAFSMDELGYYQKLFIVMKKNYPELEPLFDQGKRFCSALAGEYFRQPGSGMSMLDKNLDFSQQKINADTFKSREMGAQINARVENYDARVQEYYFKLITAFNQLGIKYNPELFFTVVDNKDKKELISGLTMDQILGIDVRNDVRNKDNSILPQLERCSASSDPNIQKWAYYAMNMIDLLSDITSRAKRNTDFLVSEPTMPQLMQKNNGSGIINLDAA